jgi:protocatechuate 3,4-dioxygenase beta subunit
MDPTSSLHKDVPVLVDIQASPSQVAVGESQSVVRVRLLDKDGKPLVNEVITFSTSMGTITAEAITNTDGWAQSVFISGQETGNAKISAQYSNQASSVVFVNVVSQLDARIQISTQFDEIYANGIDGTEIYVTLSPDAIDSSGMVLLSTSAGVIDSYIEVSGEESSSRLVSIASSKDTTAVVTATWGTYSAVVTVKFKGIQFFIESQYNELPPDGKSKTVIMAYVKETTTQIGVEDQEVRFGTSIGSIPSSAVTENTGIASAELTSSTIEGIANIVARYGATFLDTVQVEFTRSQYYFDITSESSAIRGNGEESTTVSVSVKDQNNYPVSDVLVRFGTTVGSIVDSVQFTDDTGTAETTLLSTSSNVDQWAVVTAIVDSISKTAQVLLKGILFDLQAVPTYIIADGKSQSNIKVFLKEATTGIGIAGASVRLGTNLGSIPASATTDQQGFAQIQLTSSTTQGLCRVLGEYGNILRDSVFVQFGSMVPHKLSQIQVTPSSLLANGVDQSSVKVIVSFQTNRGKIESQALTDVNGMATIKFTPYASAFDSIASVAAILDTQMVAKTIQCIGVQVDLSATPSSILADGKSTSSIKAVLKETTRKIAVPEATVYFGTDLGTIAYEAQTNTQGVAIVDLTSSTQTGTANVKVRYGQVLEDNVQVVFQESQPTYITLSATPAFIPADNQSQSTIKAVVSDASWNPVADGTMVQFIIVEGSGSIGSQQITQNGSAVTYLTSGSFPDTARIIARVGSLTSDTVKVVYTIGNVENVTVSVNPNTIPADGVSKSVVQASVTDGLGNPVENISVNFTATLGKIGMSARTDENGIARVEFSSTVIGLSTITAQVLSNGETISGTSIIQILPGSPYYVIVTYSPLFVYVRDCGKYQTVSVYADIRDEKNNPVADGTYVKFSIFASPGYGDSLSTVEPVPTVGGISQISYTSGTRSGTARIKAQVTDGDGNPLIPEVAGTSTEFVIYSGPPYIENIYDPSSTHLTITTSRLNAWSWLDTTRVSILVGDKYNNPVQKGTAVYLTTSSGVVTTTAYTDTNGIANVIWIGGNPPPTIDRFYNYTGMQDPNTGAQIGDHDSDPRIPDMEYDPELGRGRVINTKGDYGENDGIARILAWTQGIDENNQSAKPWAESHVIWSKTIAHFEQTTYADTIWPGEYARIRFELWDENGNPIVSGSDLTASIEPSNAKAQLSWTNQTTADPGQCYYNLYVYNIIDVTNDKDRPGWMRVMITVSSVNGSTYIYSDEIYLAKF